MIQDNALARARQQAHENFRAQAVERARASLGGLQQPGSQIGSFLQNVMRPGNVLPRGAQGALSGGGHPESASSLAAHQATNAMGQQLAGANLGGALNGGGAPAPMLPQPPQRIGFFGPRGGGIDQILPRLPEHPEEHLPGGNPLIHLGGGIFLHALTGELHGLGHQFAPQPGVGPVAPTPIHPGMAAA